MSVLDGGETGVEEMRHVAAAFSGAWPYLELISSATGRDPLDPQVVEAYWLGNSLLDHFDLQMMGNSVTERFQGQAGSGWSIIADTLGTSARPTHSFHGSQNPWVGCSVQGGGAYYTSSTGAGFEGVQLERTAPFSSHQACPGMEGFG
jgi:hypothetical protein